jgi:hypothetical protein
MKTVGQAPPSTAGCVSLRRWLGVAGMCALGWLAGSCSVVRTETQQTAALVKSFAGKSESQESGERSTQLQMMVMRQADQYTARVADATDPLYARAGTPNPRQRNVGAARFSDFVKLLGAKAAAQQNQGPGSLFSLALVNPLSGLDPAVRALEQTRQLAARAMYYAERAPRLWSWQAELLTYQLADQPESRQVLSNLNGVADSTQSFARTAESLPNLIRQEREAAINQLLAGVAQERSNILATLNTQEAQLRELLPQVRQTLTAGRDMANSVNGAVKSLDAFVHYVSPPDTNATPQPAATNSRPFNVLDYGTAAGEIGGMAKDLNTLLTGLNQSLPQVTRVSQQATVDAKVVVTHAFRLGLVLIVVLGLVAVLVVALCRRLGAKVERAQPTPVTKPE